MPCAVLALIFHRHWFDLIEMLWSFSEWLEATAILPQLFLLQRYVCLWCSTAGSRLYLRNYSKSSASTTAQPRTKPLCNLHFSRTGGAEMLTSHYLFALGMNCVSVLVGGMHGCVQA